MGLERGDESLVIPFKGTFMVMRVPHMRLVLKDSKLRRYHKLIIERGYLLRGLEE